MSARVWSPVHLDELTIHSGDRFCPRGLISRGLDQCGSHAERSMLSNQNVREFGVSERDTPRLFSCHCLDMVSRNLVHGIEDLLACEHARLDRDVVAAGCVYLQEGGCWESNKL